MSHRAVHRATPVRRDPLVVLSALCAPSVALLARPGVALLVAGAFLSGAVFQVSVTQAERDAYRAGVLAQEAAVTALVERTGRAESARLVGQGTAFAAQRRTEAIMLARSAVRTADLTAASAAEVVLPTDLGPIQVAAAQLTALVERTAGTVEMLEQVGRVAESRPATEHAPLAPTEPGADVVELLSNTVAEQDQDLPADGPQASADGQQASADGQQASADGPQASGDGPQALPAENRPAAVTSGPAGLDLATSAQMIAAAERLLELSAELQATTDAAHAAAALAAEQAAAEAAAEAARQAAAAELARQVEAADAAPNGAIPAHLLCPVTFQADVRLRCDAAAALDRLNAAYLADVGRDLRVVSSYRDRARQATLQATKGDLAAAPGASQHGRGVAVDFAGAGALGEFGRPLYLWLAAHAADHGWHHPTFMAPGGSGPLEPWHWEYRAP